MTFGSYIRERRNEKDLSLRELAAKIDVSAAFLHDIELGRRYPSESVLTELIANLNLSREELDKYDTRPPTQEIRSSTLKNPRYAIAFRKVLDAGMTPDELIKAANHIAKENREKI